MLRAQPLDPATPTYGDAFDEMLSSAEVFWKHATLPAGPEAPFVVVDLMMQSPRLALRTLTLAGLLRTFRPARLLALVGPDPAWRNRVWQYYDSDRFAAWARAFGATDVLDVAAIVAAVGNGGRRINVAGHEVAVAAGAAPGVDVDHHVEATLLRVARVPSTTDTGPEDDGAALAIRTRIMAGVYESLFSALRVEALVTSHVDYAQWGLAARTATAHDVPVLHAQATGGLKAYALFPESAHAEAGLRRALTSQIAEVFEQLWGHRGTVLPLAERTVWRSKGNLGRPSWWRGSGEVSRLDLRDSAERSLLRRSVLDELGLPPDRPVVGVFNHAVSDAVDGNHEAFDGLADWLERTAEFAAAHDEVSWLFLDHPSQDNYDRTYHFEGLGRAHVAHPHMAFRPSLALSKNGLFSVVDLVVTVRGSVSNEYPAYGIPALQAGWSEWSHCGMSVVADDASAYWSRLQECTAALVAGERIVTDEQQRRARLWLWAYRAGHDVATPLVPHWESGVEDELFRQVSTAMKQVEFDGDPGLVALRRLWERREPVLSRVDLRAAPADLAAALGTTPPVEPEEGPTPRLGLATAHDAVTPPVLDARVSSGSSEHVRLVDGFVRGGAILGRAARGVARVGLDLGAPSGLFEVAVELELDEASDAWWTQRSGVVGDPVTRKRGLRVRVGDGSAGVVLPARAGVPGRRVAVARFIHDQRADHGLLLLELTSEPSTSELPLPVVGVRVNAVHLRRLS